MHFEAQDIRAEQPASEQGGISAWRLRALTVGLVAVVVALIGGAGLLWARHGVAIFFDTVAAGIATCF